MTETKTRYPNIAAWSALSDARRIVVDKTTYELTVVPCGQLRVPSGRLLACDPFAAMRRAGLPTTTVAPGTYPVAVTLADVSGKSDGSHLREAYASLILDRFKPEVTRRIITPTSSGGPCPPEESDDGSYVGFSVDTGTACFADAQTIHDCMPEDETRWLEEVFDNGRETSWFKRMDKGEGTRPGIANIVLPGATAGENIVIFHSGWGDGLYPVVGGYDADGRLVAVHIDLIVVHELADQ